MVAVMLSASVFVVVPSAQAASVKAPRVHVSVLSAFPADGTGRDEATGNLYVTDIPFGRIFRIDPGGDWQQVAEWAGEPNGMKFLDERQLLVTDYRNGLMVCDIASGAVRPYLERRNSERFKGVTGGGKSIGRGVGPLRDIA